MGESPWEAPIPSKLPSRPRLLAEPRKTYSVPHRFGIGTALFTTTLFALSFGLMRWAQVPPVMLVFCSSFVAFVSVAQMIGRHMPRAASIAAGAVFLPVSAAATLLVRDGWPRPGTLDFLVACFWLAIYGAILGYVGGALLAGVFMLEEMALRLFRPRARRPR